MRAKIKTTDGKIYIREIDFSQTIVPTSTSNSIDYLKSKVELSLLKEQPFSWISLEADSCSNNHHQKQIAFTTFGVSGRVGSVNAKEAIIANDIPVHLITKHKSS